MLGYGFEENPGASLIIKNTSENVRLKYSRTSLPLEKDCIVSGKSYTHPVEK